MDKKIVLIVDDSELDAKLTMMTIKEGLFACDMVHLMDGQDLLDFLTCKNAFIQRKMEENKSICLILLDINMARISGFDALETIKLNLELKDIPVVMLTTSDYARDLDQSYQLGANSYIVKDFDFEKLQSDITGAAHYWLNINRGTKPKYC